MRQRGDEGRGNQMMDASYDDEGRGSEMITYENNLPLPFPIVCRDTGKSLRASEHIIDMQVYTLV